MNSVIANAVNVMNFVIANIVKQSFELRKEIMNLITKNDILMKLFNKS